MNTVFLIGGLGNNFFQLNFATKSFDRFCVCEIFTNPVVSKILSQSSHPRLVRELLPSLHFSIPLFNILVLFLDLSLGYLFGVTLFSVIDLRKVSARPIFRPINIIGYFQYGVKLSDFSKICVVRQSLPISKPSLLLHVRGGDFRKLGIELDYERYRAVLLKASSNCGPTTVVSNDLDWAKTICSKLGVNVSFEGGSIMDDFFLLNSASSVVCSNSTFSIFAALAERKIGSVYIPRELAHIFNLTEDSVNFEVDFF
jgi:hypothetical protein